MRLATREQSQIIDRRSQSEYGLTSLELMERAGAAAADEILSMPDILHRKVLVICGQGNNGGDGRTMTRYLRSRGVLVEAVDALLVKDQQLSSANIIVDAIFGTGLNRPLNNEFIQLIQRINHAHAFVVSLDMPSGINADTGWDFGACIRADLTLTFGCPKPGFFLNLGPLRVGTICVMDIGFPEKLVEEVASSHTVFTHQEAQKIHTKRGVLTNKSDYGRTAICAGRKNMWGAAILSSRAAYRAGSGYVYLMSFDSPESLVGQIPESICAQLPKDLNEFDDFKKVTAWVVGPALGVSEKTYELIVQLKELKTERVLLDADALTSLAQFASREFKLPKTWILTPHTGELSRLTGLSVEDIEYDRFKALKSTYERWGASILLKGYHSIYFNGSHFTILNSGNPALAKAGSGDVLSGIMGARLARAGQAQDEVDEAIKFGAYLHGLASDIWCEKYHEESLLASELVEFIPQAYRDLEQDHE